MENPTKDPIVNNVVEAFIKRSNEGLEKYGTCLSREDLSTLEWLIHAQEELMDAVLYIERLKKNFENMK